MTADALRTLDWVSKTEQELEASVGADAVDALTADDTGEHDGSDTADLDALDESLVDSIGEYAGSNPVDEVDEVDEVDDVEIADGDAAEEFESASDSLDDADDEDDADGDDIVADGEAADQTGVGVGVDDFADESGDETDGDALDEGAFAEDALDEDALGEDVAEDAAEDDEPGVSPNILEELRRADIDGPVVDAAPQDDTTAGRRRPRKPVDFDPAPVPVPLKVPRILGRKPRVRKVTRVVRHVDPWSIFKIALLANFVLYIIVLTAGVLLWNVAYATGTVENVERFFESFGWQSFEFNGGELYHAAWIAGLFAVLGFTGLWVLLATLFNLITDVVGGARFTVLEEEVVESRTSPMRRFVVRRPEPEIPAVLSDSSGPLIREAIVDDSGDSVDATR